MGRLAATCFYKWPILSLKPVQTRTILRGALKFATQISPLLNCYKTVQLTVGLYLHGRGTIIFFSRKNYCSKLSIRRSRFKSFIDRKGNKNFFLHMQSTFQTCLYLLTQSKSKTILTRSMLTISLIVFTDKLLGHVHTFYSKWYFIT